jgi:tetratricopeptide (TPR) repeat protein
MSVPHAALAQGLDEANELNKRAIEFENAGRHSDAEPLYKQSLAIREKVLGADNPDVAAALNNLAGLYYKEGRYADAEPLFKRSLAIKEKTFGPDNPDVAQSLNNLAGLYDAQGRYADAEPLYKRSLAIFEKALGPDHPDVAQALNNLAVIYVDQGRYADAEPLYKRSLAIIEKALGPDHPEVAQSLNNLAGLYEGQGRYADAETLLKRSLAIGEKALGPDHPDVATKLNNLAVIYVDQGRYADAEPLYKRSLAIREKALGPNHPEVARSLNNLAALYERQGRYADAEPLGRYADAEPLYKRSLAITEKALGPNHRDVALSLSNLALLYATQGRYADAYSYIQRTFANRSSYRNPSFLVILGAQLSQLLTPEQSFADSFNVFQFASSSAAADAVQKLAQRYAAGSDELAQLVRHDQDLIGEKERIDKALIAAVSREPKQRNQSNEDRMRARASEIQSERSQIETVLAQRFPDYVALSRPQPLTLKETQALLGEDEAVVAIDIGDQSYAWVITKTSAVWTDIPASSKKLNALLRKLKQSSVAFRLPSVELAACRMLHFSSFFRRRSFWWRRTKGLAQAL